MMTALFERYEQLSKRAQELLEKGIQLMREGYAPDVPLCQEISAALNSLRSAYDDIRRELPAQVFETEMPTGERSVIEYEEAWQNSMIHWRNAVRDVLDEFIRVCSDDQRYMDAIIPHIDVAKGLIEQIEAVKETAPAFDISTYRLFLDGVKADLSRDVDLYDRLLDCSVFNARIVKGLSDDKYYIREAATEDGADVPAGSPPEKQDGAETSDVDPRAGDLTPANEKEAENKDESEENAREISSQEEQDDEGPTTEDTAKEESSNDQPNHDNLDESAEELIHPISPIKSAKLPSEQKLREIIYRTGTVFGFLLDKLVFTGLMDEETVFKAAARMKWHLTRAQCADIIAYLEKKGIICVYPYESRNILCFTALMAGCLQKSSLSSSLKRMLNIKKIGKIGITGEQDMPLTKFKSHLAKVDLYNKAFDLLSEDKESAAKLATATWEREKRCFLMNLSLDEGEKLPLRIVPAEEFAESIPADGEGLFCSSDMLPTMSDVDDSRHYCLTPQALFQWSDHDWRAITHGPLQDHDAEGFEPSPSSDKEAVPNIDEVQPDEETGGSGAGAIQNEVPVGENNQSVPEQQDGLWLDDLSEASQNEPEVAVDGFTDLSSVEMAERLLAAAANGSKPSDERMAALIDRLLTEGERSNDVHNMHDQLVEALVLAKLLSPDEAYPKCRTIYNQLNAAIPLFKDGVIHTGTTLVTIFADETKYTPVAKLCAFIYGMLFPAHAHDYIFAGMHNNAFAHYETHFSGLDVLKPLYHKAMEGLKIVPAAFSPANLSALSDSKLRSEHMKAIQAEAKELLKAPTVKQKIHGVPELIDICFGSQSDLYYALEIVSENDKDLREDVEKTWTSYCRDNEIALDKIEELLDSQWGVAAQKYSSRRMGIKYDARKLLINALLERLTILHEWLDETSSDAEPDVEKLRAVRADVLAMIDSAIDEINAGSRTPDSLIMLGALEVYRAKLQNLGGMSFATLLRSGSLVIDQNELVLNDTLNKIEFAEPWRMMLNHLSNTEYDLRTVYEKILAAAPESELYDNYGQLEAIGTLLHADPSEYQLTEERLHDTISSADLQAKNFREKLEISYAFNRISENDRERLAMLADPETSELQSFFYTHKAFGCWRAFLNALRLQIREIAVRRLKDVRSLLDQAKALLPPGEENILLTEAERLIVQDQNYAAAEEYIHRFRIGEKTLPFETNDSATNYYLSFISDPFFSELFSFCELRKESSLLKLVKQYIEKNPPEGWTTRHIEDAHHFIGKWPGGKQSVNPKSIQEFFTQLGFEVDNCADGHLKNEASCILTVKKSEQNQADYRHPISIFGTRMNRQIEVVCLFGKRTAKQIVDDSCKLGIKGTFIVLLDADLSAADRRRMAQYFFTQKNVGQASFLVIDRVLALYLALLPNNERLPAMLQCTLPYTIYQPFTNGSGSTDDEMFFGRVNELASIRDMGGASIVYGGRQLGKTALLERAMHLDNIPARKEFAVKADFKDHRGEREFVEILIEACNDTFRKSGITMSPCSGIRDFCAQIRELLHDDKIATLRLLLDETDAFLDSISGSNYNELLPLIELQRGSERRLKFVLAGLHNVCRAKNATRNNGLFGQLGAPLCVKPLTAPDAQNLLVRPLRYLGFRVSNETHIGTILINTNYYPGIIQFFGYTLVQMLDSQYTQYYDAVRGNPPFILHDEQLASIMNSRDLNSNIKDRIRWTLEMDERYFMLARCIAVLYHLSANDYSSISNGFGVGSILEVAKDMFDIHCLASLSEQETIALLDEMEEMGILSRPSVDENRYLLRRRSFIDVIGTSLEALEHDIELNNEEVVVNA